MCENRATKNFKREKMKIHNKYSDEEYYMFMLNLRKELLSDILEYEDFWANKIILNFKIMSLTLKDLVNFLDNKIQRPNINNILLEVKKNKIKSIISIFNKKYNKFKNVKLRILFDNLSIGDKIKFVKNLEKVKLEKTLLLFSMNKDIYLTHIKNISFLDEFYFPFLEYLRDIRNILSHRMISTNQDHLFSNAYIKFNRKHNHSFFLKVFRDQLMIIHKKTFFERFKEKVLNNNKIKYNIFEEIMNQSMYKII